MVELILPGSGAQLVSLLMQRRGRPTRLKLNCGGEITAWNCVWGMEYGREWEHLTLNISPRMADAAAVLVSAADVLFASDPDSGRRLYERPIENAGARTPASSPSESVQPRDWIGT